MKIASITPLAIPDVYVIAFQRFRDERGYGTETFRQSDLCAIPFLATQRVMQGFESHSLPGTVRGMHFQWDAPMGKLVRTLEGRMVDLVLDIRKGSPHYGQMIAYDMPSDRKRDVDEWIWVPPGFAHGNYHPQESRIEYLCTAEHNPRAESGITPLCENIKTDMMDARLRKEFSWLLRGKSLRMSGKDRDAQTLDEWTADPRSENFPYTPR